MERLRTDVVVVGSGMAGLSFALSLPDHLEVVVVTKKERATSSTNWAQGGIASAWSSDDDPTLHRRDTLLAGAGLSHPAAVETLVREGPGQVDALTAWGAEFDRTPEGGLSLGMEGGHSRRRIARSADRTGREIERTLLDAVAAAPRIEVWEDHLALDLLVGRDAGGRRRCMGIRVLHHPDGALLEVEAGATLLASGGCGQLYRHTTNPSIATGDGIAMAWRAGAHVANLEFIQFHPTALHPTGDPAVLVSEALRGEGGVLRTRDDEPFMDQIHPRGSLAPRDLVARAIHTHLAEGDDEYVLLDVSSIPTDTLERRFPGTVEACRVRGIDPGRGIPVAPAAHYVCGGIVTDGQARTTLPGLWAAGETACTGIHGANRLASNSLLEAVVYARRAAASVADGPDPGPLQPEAHSLRHASDRQGTPDPEAVDRDRARLREAMWLGAGIVRSRALLKDTRTLVDGLAAAHERRPGPPTVAGTELRNLLTVAGLVVRSALLRRESRGLHFLRERPWRDNERFLRDTVLFPPGARSSRTGTSEAGGERPAVGPRAPAGAP